MDLSLLAKISGVLLIFSGVFYLYYFSKRPGIFLWSLLHFLVGGYLVFSAYPWMAFLAAVIPAVLIHLGLHFSEILLNVRGRRFLVILPYLLSLIFGFIPKAVPIYWIFSLFFFMGVLLIYFRKPRPGFDRRIVIALLLSSTAGLVPLLINRFIPSASSLVLLMPILFLAMVIPASRRQVVDYQVQSEKRTSLGSLLAGLAHEINNPMTFIASNVEPLREAIQHLRKVTPHPDNETAQALEDLERIASNMEEGSTRARALVEKIRYMPHEKKEPKEEIDLVPILDQTINLLSPKWKGKIRIERHFEELPKIRGAAGELGQVFTNLIANACEATPSGGMVHVAAHQGPAGVRITIRDSGPGIPRDHIGRIFDPFFTTKEDQGGTGLGLSISLQIVKNHKGTIEVKSEEGQGTEFMVFLPY